MINVFIYAWVVLILLGFYLFADAVMRDKRIVRLEDQDGDKFGRSRLSCYTQRECDESTFLPLKNGTNCNFYADVTVYGSEGRVYLLPEVADITKDVTHRPTA